MTTKLYNSLIGLAFAILCSLPVWATDQEQVSSTEEPGRELIYCADLMTHEEREAYRARMRAARTQEEKAAVRQAHQQAMRARAKERGLDPIECEPQRVRERLRQRQRGGTP